MKKCCEVGSLSSKRDGSGPASWGDKWHSDSALYYPTHQSQFNELGACIDQFIIQGHTPDRPLLNAQSKITALGSCFAAELRHFLSESGLSCDSFWVPSGLNNTFALHDFIHWCISGEESSRGYRYESCEDGIKDWMPQEELACYRGYIKNSDAFVFTTGLAEVWEDNQTGKVFWRGVPESVFKKNRHRLRLSTVEENVDQLERLVTSIRSVNTNAPIILTLSPVPLKATFTKKSCITADCVSKSTLRLALHYLLERGHANVWYWPSFEIVKWLGAHLPYPVYGTDDQVTRHVSRHLVIEIMSSFIRSFYGENFARELAQKYVTTLSLRTGGPGEPPKIYSGTIVRS